MEYEVVEDDRSPPFREGAEFLLVKPGSHSQTPRDYAD